MRLVSRASEYALPTSVEISGMRYDEMFISAIRVSGANPGTRVQIRRQRTDHLG